LREFSRDARINTDDLTLLEYHAPQALLVPGLQDKNRAEILRVQKDSLPVDLPPDLRDNALAAAAASAFKQQDEDGATRFAAALAKRPVTAKSAAIAGRMALGRGDWALRAAGLTRRWPWIVVRSTPNGEAPRCSDVAEMPRTTNWPGSNTKAS